jgi:KaiC/GvpD/RAD55 family RecA-like ATPase
MADNGPRSARVQLPDNFESTSINETIDGFDRVLQKGLGPRQNILLLGPPFSGKSTLAFQFLTTGLKSGKRAIIVTTTDTPEGIRGKARAYGWNLKEYEDRGELRYIDCYSQIVGLPPENSAAVFRSGITEGHFEKISLIISAIISDYWTEGSEIRLVFDNLSTLFYYSDLVAIVRFLHILLGRLKAANVTSMLILESGIHDEQITTIMRSLCDSVLQLAADGNRHYIQGILGTSSLGRCPVEISDKGLKVADPPINRTA